MEKKARSLDARRRPAFVVYPGDFSSGGRRSRKKSIEIFGVCSMKDCTGAPIAAMTIQYKAMDGKSLTAWVSQCLRHSKGHGKLDMNKVTLGTRSNR